jgi:hypothetical protein
MTKCNVDNLTLGEIKELSKFLGAPQHLSSGDNHRFKVGDNYFIRTVTMIIVGRLEWVGDKELELSSASWIADTGRFYDALKHGKLNEIEPFTNNVLLGRGSIIDATVWTHKLPDSQK